jgi:prolyl 4-hydroxylase
MSAAPENLSIEGSKHPHFIGAFKFADPSVCDRVVDLFETKADMHSDGSYNLGQVDTAVKHSRDWVVQPKNLRESGHEALNEYMAELHRCYLAYIEDWEFLGSFASRVHIGRFNIQRYESGGHFNKLHSERMGVSSMHRVLVWMTYLNDVPAGGETEFPYYGLRVSPEKGKTLIWPAEWTHVHRGCTVETGPKYVITGWMHFPPVI